MNCHEEAKETKKSFKYFYDKVKKSQGNKSEFSNPSEPNFSQNEHISMSNNLYDDISSNGS